MSVMDRLSKQDPRIEMATARAEVEFREREICSQWEQQPLDTSTWKMGEPTTELPAYWGPLVEYAATILLAHAQAAAEAKDENAMEPSQFERFKSNCPLVVAEAAYTRKGARYARVPLRSLDLVIGKLARDAERRAAAELKALEDGVWKRYRNAICGPSGSEQSAVPDICNVPGAPSGIAGREDSDPSAEADRKSPAEYFDAYRAKNPGISYRKLAGRIGISYESLFTIKGETAWVRDYAYAAVAGELGCSPADLHPRHLPQRPRRNRSSPNVSKVQPIKAD
jgi:hypothetical protein